MAKKSLENSYLDLLVKVKRIHKDAVLPAYSLGGDAGSDITCVYYKKEPAQNWFDRWFPVYTYYTGIKLEIPETHWGLLAARSSISKLSAWLANGLGVIEPTYRGEILFKFRTFGAPPYEKGDRVGQIIYLPKYVARHTDVGDKELSPTVRDEGGFGSTGK